MKRNHDVKASQSPWEGPYTEVERLLDVSYWIRGKRKAQPKVVHVNRLWQYQGPGQYTWEDSEEQSPPPTRTRPEILEELRTIPIKGTRPWTRKRSTAPS
ncbi:hypothetical protein Hamer_G012173, partial [Homarus americanus]